MLQGLAIFCLAMVIRILIGFSDHREIVKKIEKENKKDGKS